VVAHLERVTGTVSAEPGSGSDSPSLAAGATVHRGMVVTTGSASRAAFRLADGASLRLDVDSRARFTAADNVSLERGALYLDTGGDPLHPLVVHTPLGDVHDVGTQFEVRLAPQRVVVRVRQGEVSLGAAARSYAAKAGSELSLAADGSLERHAVSTHDDSWDWVMEIAPPFHLEGSHLSDFLTWVSRETGLQVRFTDPSLAATASQVELHGTLRDLPPDQTLSAVLPTCGLHSRVAGGTLVLSPAR